MVPVAFVATGISTQLTIPASVSNDIAPMLKLSADKVPLVKSYSTAPESTESPPLIEVVASPPLVLIAMIGIAEVEVAIVQA